MPEILRVLKARHAGDYRLDLTFNDGSSKVIDLRPHLNGPIFEPLRDREFFSRGELDPICGTVVWPNGADLAPEALMAIEEVSEHAT